MTLIVPPDFCDDEELLAPPLALELDDDLLDPPHALSVSAAAAAMPTAANQALRRIRIRFPKISGT